MSNPVTNTINAIKDIFSGPKRFEGEPMVFPEKAVYKSPSGLKVPFDFEDLTSSVESKSAPFELASGNGTYVQPGKRTGGRFPMRVFFSGSGYRDKAEAFLSAILEPGEGVLSHPSYRQDIPVVLVGEVTRTDPYKSGAGQVIFDVSFFETTGLQVGGDSGRKSLFDSLLDASAVDFSNKAKLSDPVDKAGFMDKVLKAVKKIGDVMDKASAGVGAVTQGMEDVGDSIDRGIDTVIGKPLALARQVQIMVGEPRRQAEGTKTKLAGYKNLANDIFGGTDAEVRQYSNDSINTFHLNKVIASALIANSAMMAADGSGEFQSRSDFISAVDGLKALEDGYQEWHDSNYTAVEGGEIDESTSDTGDGVPELREVVRASISDLITASLKAKTQFRAALTRERTPIDLCFELYGTTAPDTMDMFLLTNQIAGDEHILIPKGREVVWYG
jgi:prophage DNA circulation protein